MKHVLSLILFAATFAACPTRAHPAPLAPCGETIGTLPFTIAAFDSPDGIVWHTIAYTDPGGVRFREEIPAGHSLILGTQTRMGMEFAPAAAETGEVYRTRWMSGGFEQEVETERRANEPPDNWARRHRNRVDSLALLFPPDTHSAQFLVGACATPHSQGGPAEITLLVSGDLALTNMPRAQTGLLVRAPFLSSQPVPFGEGFLCLHPLHLVRETAFVTDAFGSRLLTPHEGALYQAVFRDWAPMRANVTPVIDTRGPL